MVVYLFFLDKLDYYLQHKTRSLTIAMTVFVNLLYQGKDHFNQKNVFK